MEISTGLLIEGCPDSTNRSESLEMVKMDSGRRKRALDCETDCGADSEFSEMCMFDCSSADSAGLTEPVSKPYFLSPSNFYVPFKNYMVYFYTYIGTETHQSHPHENDENAVKW